MRIFKIVIVTVFTAVFVISGVQGQTQKKKTIAVLNFVNSGGVDKDEISILTDRFNNFLVNTNVYKVLEREKMDAILKEQDFTMTDNCNSAECAVQIGQLLGMELMVAGDVGLLGNTYSIDLRLIDVTTGKIIQTETQDYEGKIDGLLGAMTTIANTFAGVKSSVSDNQKSTAVTQSSSDTFTDPRDGKTYRTVKIGDQVWMAENLNYDAGSGSGCYNDDTSNCNIYGRLYTWEAAKLAIPKGWHLPSKEEYEMLLESLGGEGKSAYKQIINGGSSGFNALLGGDRSFDGYFKRIGERVGVWSSTGRDNSYVWYLDVSSYSQEAVMNDYPKNTAFSVRLIRD